MSGRWAGCCACGAHGAALEDRPRFAALHHRAALCQHGLVGGWPKQRRFDRRQPDRRLDQRGSRQYAEGHRLGRAQPGCRLFALGAVVSDGRLWGTGGHSGRQIRRKRGSGRRSEDQDCGEPRCQPRLQPLASMRPRPHRHPGRLPPQPDAARSRLQSAAAEHGLGREQRQERPWQRPGAARRPGMALAPYLLRWMLRRRSKGAIRPASGFGYIGRHRDLEVRS